MSDERKQETHIYGDVHKLTNIGIVKGNVLIVNDEALKKSLMKNWKPQPTEHTFPTKDVTSYIKVIIKSNRFGRRTQVRVPKDMTINAFIDTVVDILDLPWKTSIDEFRVSFVYRYSIVYKDKKISLEQTLSDAQISDSAVVELFISVIWTDEIEKAEQAEQHLFYEMGSRMRELEERRVTRLLRGEITNTKIKSWADKFFEHVDKIGIPS